MRESVKSGIHAGLAAGHLACACYHIHKGGIRNWHLAFHLVAFSYDFLAMIEHHRRGYVDEITETFERLRFASAECSGLEFEEEEKSEMDQATTATPKKEYCGKCHMSFGSAEKRVAIDRKTVMHEDCYVKHLHELQQRSNRISAFLRHVH